MPRERGSTRKGASAGRKSRPAAECNALINVRHTVPVTSGHPLVPRSSARSPARMTTRLQTNMSQIMTLLFSNQRSQPLSQTTFCNRIHLKLVFPTNGSKDLLPATPRKAFVRKTGQTVVENSFEIQDSTTGEKHEEDKEERDEIGKNVSPWLRAYIWKQVPCWGSASKRSFTISRVLCGVLCRVLSAPA